LSRTSELVEVYIARGEAEANIIKGLLETYGIPSLLKSQAAPSVHAFAVDDMGQVSVMVRPADADDARHLINHREAHQGPVPGGDEGSGNGSDQGEKDA